MGNTIKKEIQYRKERWKHWKQCRRAQVFKVEGNNIWIRTGYIFRWMPKCWIEKRIRVVESSEYATLTHYLNEAIGQSNGEVESPEAKNVLNKFKASINQRSDLVFLDEKTAQDILNPIHVARYTIPYFLRELHDALENNPKSREFWVDTRFTEIVPIKNLK